MDKLRVSAFLLVAALLATSAPLLAEPGDAFTLADASGTEFVPTEQQGIGVYLFWGGWCPYCQALMPHLQSVEDEYGDAVTVYALNFRDEKDPAEYMEQHGFEFVLLPEADAVAEVWGVRGTPAVYVLDAEGNVCFDRYELAVGTPDGWDDMDHRQKAQRRAPFWAARPRQAIDSVNSNGGC